MTAKIAIFATSEQLTNALCAAVQTGLDQAGFSNVSVTPERDAEEPESVLDAMRREAPELFATQIDIDAECVVEDDESLEEELETADSGD